MDADANIKTKFINGVTQEKKFRKKLMKNYTLSMGTHRKNKKLTKTYTLSMGVHKKL